MKNNTSDACFKITMLIIIILAIIYCFDLWYHNKNKYERSNNIINSVYTVDSLNADYDNDDITIPQQVTGKWEDSINR